MKATDSPLVSIAIVAYNQRDLIGQTIESALAQTYKNIEIIIADDGSTDGTQEIIRSYIDQYPKIVKGVLAPTNGGITANSNLALKECRGDYIAWLGGDDLFLPQKIESQINWFLAHPEGTVCGSDADVFDSDTDKTILTYRSKAYLSGKGAHQIIAQRNAPPSSALMINRKICGDITFDIRTPVVSDWLYFVEAAIRGEIGYIPEVLVRYRRHPQNVTAGGSSRSYLDDRLIATDIVIQRYPQYHGAAKQQRAWCLYGAALRDYFDGKFQSAARRTLQALSEYPLHLRIYLLLLAIPWGYWGRNTISKYKQRLAHLIHHD